MDELVLQGYGNTELRATEPKNKLSLWAILDIGFGNILAVNEKNELYDKKVLVLYSGSDED